MPCSHDACDWAATYCTVGATATATTAGSHLTRLNRRTDVPSIPAHSSVCKRMIGRRIAWSFAAVPAVRRLLSAQPMVLACSVSWRLFVVALVRDAVLIGALLVDGIQPPLICARQERRGSAARQIYQRRSSSGNASEGMGRVPDVPCRAAKRSFHPRVPRRRSLRPPTCAPPRARAMASAAAEAPQQAPQQAHARYSHAGAAHAHKKTRKTASSRRQATRWWRGIATITAKTSSTKVLKP